MASRTSKTGLMRRATELGSLAAPTIVVLTGAMYLAAWAEREAALNGFGLTGDEFSHSLQTMLARGYLLLLIIGAVTALGLGILWLLVRSGASAGESDTKPPRSRPGFLEKASEAVDSFLRLHFYFLTGLLILAGCDIGGREFGLSRAAGIREVVESRCVEACSAYLTADRRVIGQLIEEDNEHMAIYAGHHVALLRNAEVRTVIPYRLGMQLPSLAIAPGSGSNIAASR